MNCEICGHPMDETFLVCPLGPHKTLPEPAEVLPDWAWAEWVQEQGIGE